MRASAEENPTDDLFGALIMLSMLSCPQTRGSHTERKPTSVRSSTSSVSTAPEPLAEMEMDMSEAARSEMRFITWVLKGTGWFFWCGLREMDEVLYDRERSLCEVSRQFARSADSGRLSNMVSRTSEGRSSIFATLY
jgi:hypothetical protein